jgi:hypothetical protein
MVFVSPLFTDNGISIMEAIAFGGRNADRPPKEQNWDSINVSGQYVDSQSNNAPIVIIIPHLSLVKQTCGEVFSHSYSLLGLGDILIPGICVNYAIVYDLIRPNRKFYTYFVANMIGKLNLNH